MRTLPSDCFSALKTPFGRKSSAQVNRPLSSALSFTVGLSPKFAPFSSSLTLCVFVIGPFTEKTNGWSLSEPAVFKNCGEELSCFCHPRHKANYFFSSFLGGLHFSHVLPSFA